MQEVNAFLACVHRRDVKKQARLSYCGQNRLNFFVCFYGLSFKGITDYSLDMLGLMKTF